MNGCGIHMRKGRKGELVPFTKARRVIYTKKRGGARMQISAATVILWVLGILCVLYCIGIGLFMGYGTRFFLIWGVMGAGFMGLGWVLAHKEWTHSLPAWFRTTFLAVAGAGILVFLLIEGLILAQFGAKAPDDADYCLILGAQMKSHGPSDVLRRRLDTAIAYLEENPQTMVIVSGGQGANEPVTEARGMYEYLTQRGIAPERILLEEKSGNTWENLHYSSELLDPEKDSVVLVTNNFHVFRATGIAKKMGYENLSGLAADSYPFMVPNNMLREFLGVIKDSLVGNL